MGAREADLIDGATSAFSQLQESRRINRKLFHIVLELVQNIFRHTEPGAFRQKDAHCTLTISLESRGYAVVSGNPVSKACVPSLAKKLQEVNALSSKELSDVYRRLLQDTRLSAKGGAGVGFLDMARRSGEKLPFDFQEISKDYCFFRLKLLIPQNQRINAD